MNKTKITYTFILLYFPFFTYGQEVKSELKSELDKIDSIVELTISNEKKYFEGIAEGPIEYKNIFKKNGGWEAYFLYKNQTTYPPIRIRYNESGNKKYQKIELYYLNEKLIFANLSIKFNRGKQKNNPIDKNYYFKNSHLIFDSNPENDKYGEDYIRRTENQIRKMIYE